MDIEPKLIVEFGASRVGIRRRQRAVLVQQERIYNEVLLVPAVTRSVREIRG